MSVFLRRLGDVLYYLGTAISLIFLAGSGAVLLGYWAKLDGLPPRPGDVVALSLVSGGCAVTIWLLGRLSKYLLAGRDVVLKASSREELSWKHPPPKLRIIDERWD